MPIIGPDTNPDPKPHTHTYTHAHSDDYPYTTTVTYPDRDTAAPTHSHTYAHVYGEPYYPAANAHSDHHAAKARAEAERVRGKRGVPTPLFHYDEDCWDPTCD